MPRYRQGAPNPVWLPHWEYLGGQNIAGDGTVQTATIPAGTQIFEIDAEDGEVFYTINGPSVADIGYVPLNGARIVGPLVNLNALFVNCAAGVTAHIMYFRESTKRRMG